jgi:hypothetical protein
MNDRTARKLCFVIGPIGDPGTEERTHSDWVLQEIIRPAMASFPAFDVKRADEDQRPGQIDAQIINDLLEADLVIADLSTYSPNAFYEIGIRHMTQKPIIHMVLATEKIPFDLRSYRAIKFSIDTAADIGEAREALKGQVAETQKDGYQVENQITKTRAFGQLKENATQREQVLLDRIADLTRRLSQIESPSPSLFDEEPIYASISLKPNPRERRLSSLKSALGRISQVEHKVLGEIRAVVPNGNKFLLEDILKAHGDIIAGSRRSQRIS